MTQAEITVYTTKVCPYCVRAKKILERNGLSYREVDVSDPEAREALVQKTGMKTVPQIFIGPRHVGGSDELYALEQSGELSKWLAAS